MSLRVVPRAAHPDSYSTAEGGNNTSNQASTVVPGLIDPLRSKLSQPPSSSSSSKDSSSSRTTLTSAHPLEARLANWTTTQESLKMESLRRTFGIAEPVRRAMEMKIVAAGEWRPACLGGSAGVGMDVLKGADMGELGWEDIFTGDETREPADFHTEMELNFRMNW